MAHSVMVNSHEVIEGGLTAITLQDQAILLTRWQGEVYAIAAYCPHASGDLSQGSLYRGRLDCPVHGYRFELTSGRCLWPPDDNYRLRHFAVSEIDGVITVTSS
jgi:nitrite reductase/ring-hydroxylating ferredoxin subunit